MPEFDNLKNIWKSAENQIAENETIDLKTIKQAITKQSIGITSQVLKSTRAGILALIFSIILFSLNTFGYYGNNLIFIISVSCLLLSSSLLLYLRIQYINFNKIDQSDLSLQDLILAKLKYFKNSLFYVHQVIGLSIILLIFSLNLFFDNSNGNFPVNNMGLFVGLMMLAYLIVVIMLHLSHKLYSKQFTTALSDINKFKLTELVTEHRKQKLIRIVFLCFILVSTIAGLWVLFSKIIEI